MEHETKNIDRASHRLVLDLLDVRRPGGGYGEGLKVKISFSLSKLPTAKETAHLIIQHIFFFHGLSIDVILDQALSVTSFSRAVCLLICSSTRENPNQDKICD